MNTAKTNVLDKVENHTRSAALTSDRAQAALQGGFATTDFRQMAGNLAVQRLLRDGTLQAKLNVGSPGDMYEQEADRVAAQVVSSTGVASVQRKCGACPADQPCPKCEENDRVQAKELPGQAPQIDKRAESLMGSARGRGEPLSPSTRELFEPRFGTDFSQVRIHADSSSADAASAINARAFTAGKDIVFGADQYSPHSRDGQLLLAHELTHVVQQDRDATDTPLRRAPAGPPKPQNLPKGALDASYFTLGGSAPTTTGVVHTQAGTSPDKVGVVAPRIEWTEKVTMAKDSPSGQNVEVGFMQTLMASKRQALYRAGAVTVKKTQTASQSRDQARTTSKDAKGREVASLPPGGFYADSQIAVDASGKKERIQGRYSLTSTQGNNATIKMYDEPVFDVDSVRDGAPLIGTAGTESFRLSIMAVEQGMAPLPLKNFDWTINWTQSINASVPSAPTGSGGSPITMNETQDGAPQMEGPVAADNAKEYYEFASLAEANAVSTETLISNLTLARAAGDAQSFNFTVDALKARNPAIIINITCTETARFFGKKDNLAVDVQGTAISGAKSIAIGKGDTVTVTFNLLDAHPEPADIGAGSAIHVFIAVTSDRNSPSDSVSFRYPFRPLPLTTLEIGNIDAGTYLVTGYLW